MLTLPEHLISPLAFIEVHVVLLFVTGEIKARKRETKGGTFIEIFRRIFVPRTG